jgi:hypothetical protein
MSGLDGLQLDADGYLDMDQYPDDGTDLAGAELDQLREALHSDPVEEPTAEQWDAMFDDVVTAGDTGPFALDDVEGLTVDDGGETSTPDDVLDGDDLPDAEDLPDDGDVPVDDLDGLALDDAGADDLDLDVTTDLDGGIDLATDHDVDDVFSPEALDDAPADISHDFEDLL